MFPINVTLRIWTNYFFIEAKRNFRRTRARIKQIMKNLHLNKKEIYKNYSSDIRNLSHWNMSSSYIAQLNFQNINIIEKDRDKFQQSISGRTLKIIAFPKDHSKSMFTRRRGERTPLDMDRHEMNGKEESLMMHDCSGNNRMAFYFFFFFLTFIVTQISQSNQY